MKTLLTSLLQRSAHCGSVDGFHTLAVNPPAALPTSDADETSGRTATNAVCSALRTVTNAVADRTAQGVKGLFAGVEGLAEGIETSAVFAFETFTGRSITGATVSYVGGVYGTKPACVHLAHAWQGNRKPMAYHFQHWKTATT